MTFWQFLDKQIGRLNPSGVAGAGIFLLTGIVLLMLGLDRKLAENDLFKTLAQAIVVQGLIGLAMAAWFTKKSSDGPEDVRVVNPPSDPANVEQVADPMRHAPPGVYSERQGQAGPLPNSR